MKELSQDIYLITPNLNDSEKTTTLKTTTNLKINSTTEIKPPNLCILFGWMDADIRHVSKYAATYSLLYPLASILILKSRQSHFYRFKSTNCKALLPAINAIKELGVAKGGSERRVLVHTFSNGGCFTLRNLDEAMRLSSSSSSSTSTLSNLSSSTSSSSTLVDQLPEINTESKGLEAQAFLFDSCPGRVTFRISLRAFTAAINPKWLKIPAGLVVALLFVVGRINDFIRRRPSFMVIISAYLIRHLPRASSQLYLYSNTDLLIGAKDVENHADSVVRSGVVEVVREKFEGTQHVAHIRDVKEGQGNEKRYWEAVQNIWKSSEERKLGLKW